MASKESASGPPAPTSFGPVFTFSALYLAIAYFGLLVLPRLDVGLPVLLGAFTVLLLAAFVAVAVGLLLALVRLPVPAWGQVVGTLLGTALVLAGKKYGPVPLYPVADYLIVVTAALFGGLIARLVRERNLLVPVAVVAAAVDVWGVYWGFVAEVSKKAPKVVEHFSSSVPVPKAAHLPLPSLEAMGIGDFLFTAVYLAAVWRLGMSTRRTVVGIVVAVLLSPLTFLLLPRLQALPGLPFIGLGVIAANWKSFDFSREERFALLWAALAALAVIGSYLLLRRLF